MERRLFEVRSFVSTEMDIERAMQTGSPISVTFVDGRRARIQLASVEVKANGLYRFHGTMAEVAVEGLYGNDSKKSPKKLLSGFGMVKL
jgi:hypothetical protein